jgi:hypothetical protein
MNSLSQRERRLVAVLLLVALVAVAFYAAIFPITDGFSARTAARSKLFETYARDENAVLQIASARRAAEAQRRDAPRYRLTSGNAAEAADGLKERVASLITATRGDLRSVEDIAAPAGSIRVRADARLTTAQLAAAITSLQRGEPLLVIEALTVAADDAVQSGRASPMDVRLEVSGSYPAPAPR